MSISMQIMCKYWKKPCVFSHDHIGTSAHTFPASPVAQWRRIRWQCRNPRRCMFNPWVAKITWIRKWLLIPVFLPGRCNGWSSLVGYSLWGHKRVGKDSMTKQQQFIIQEMTMSRRNNDQFYFTKKEMEDFKTLSNVQGQAVRI